MILTQYYLGCLAHASYLIADKRTKDAIVVDPQRDIEQDLRDAKAGGISLAAVGATSLVSFLHRLRLGQVEIRTGLLFAVAGI